MPSVIVVKRYEREFRLPLYKALKERLSQHGIDFELIIGQPDTNEVRNVKDAVWSNPFGPSTRNHYFHLGDRFLSYQNVFPHIRHTDLVIVQQSNTALLNYLLLLRRRFRPKPKIAFWGHGINFQAKHRDSLPQQFKLWVSNFADHWFAYTEATSEILINNGYPRKRITVLNNTIDVTGEKAVYDSISASEVDAVRRKYRIREGDRVGIFCGSLYKLKGIDFLLKSVELIKREYGRFHFFVLGGGEMEGIVRSFEKNNFEWFHYFGFSPGREKQLYFKLADVQLITGVVGLNIIDSFYSQTPLITIDATFHSPEILYLEHGRNGIMTKNTVADYVDAVVAVLGDEEKLAKLRQGCLKSSSKYTIANMADSFCKGILQTFERP